MDNNRKQIIVKEIMYWKQSRMLPEQYCDYLLALYTEGDHTDNPQKRKGSIKLSMEAFFLALIAITSIVIYFTELSFDLQIGFMSLLLATAIFLTYYLFKKGLHFQVGIIIAALILLFISVDVTVHYFPQSSIYLYGSLLMNTLLWFLIGRKLKLFYFLLSGGLGTGVVLLSFLFR